jgi:hypothetical protein
MFALKGLGKGTYRYVTSVLDPHILPPYVVVDLYARRWRISDPHLDHVWCNLVNRTLSSVAGAFLGIFEPSPATAGSLWTSLSGLVLRKQILRLTFAKRWKL